MNIARFLSIVTTVSALESNLRPFCGGTGPNVITSVYQTDVPQFCVPSSVDSNTERCFYVFVPENTPRGEGVPLVFDMHGYSSCPLISTYYTGWFQKARDEKFVAVWPLGVTDPSVASVSCWGLPGGRPVVVGDTTLISGTCCCHKDDGYVAYNDVEDDVFLRAAIEYVVKNIGEMASADDGQLSIDLSRIFMAGHSNGGMAAFTMAALHSDLVSGVAVHAGKLITSFPESYSPVPVWMVHGKKDVTLPYGASRRNFNAYDSAPDIFNYVADKNGCSDEIITKKIEEEEGTIQTRSNCVNGADVTLVTLDKGGHVPYRGESSNDDPGSIVTVVDTTQLAWNFLLDTTAADDTASNDTASNDTASNDTAKGPTSECNLIGGGSIFLGTILLTIFSVLGLSKV